MHKTLGFEVGPEFEPVFRQGVVVGGLVVARVGVHVFAAVALDQFAEFIRLYVFVGSGDGIFPGFFELLQLRVIPANGIVTLGNVGGVGGFDFCKRGLFGGVVGGANLVGAF